MQKEELDTTKKSSERKIRELEDDNDELRRKLKLLEGDLQASEEKNDSYKS